MAHRKLAIILESHLERVPTPNAYDPAWYSMAQLLAHAGLSEAEAHIDYLVPAKVEAKRVGKVELVGYVNALQERLAAYQPHFVLLLDRWGKLLWAFHGEKMSCDDWRGSVLLAKYVTPGTKVMATYAPTRLRMDYGLTGVVRFDLRRATEELRTDGLEVPVDEIDVDLPHHELVASLQYIYDTDQTVAVDIEGYPDWITCIGFATSANRAFVVPFIRQDGTSWWTEPEEQELWHWVKLVLEKPTVRKRMHNGSYEMFCLAWSYGIVIEGWEDDTMVMWFELYAELEKNLGFISSILTKHPWYKHERKSTDDTVALLYNGKDCCRTYEICDKMLAMLKPQQMEHYRFNMQLLAPLNYMQLRGIRYDHAEAKRRLAETQEKIYELQDQINYEASKSESRKELHQFYAALAPETGGHSLQCGHRPDDSVDRQTMEALLPLLTTAFCQARRLEKRTVTETSWQPMRHNGKKWVKAGKRISDAQINQPDSWAFGEGVGYMRWEGDKEPDPVEGCCPIPQGTIWAKPVRKSVERNFPAAVETFEDVQHFAKDSCRSDCNKAIALLRRSDAGAALTAAQRGELATLLGIHIKISASGREEDEVQDDGTVQRGEELDANWYLYQHCKLPKQYIKEGNKNTDRLASDAEAVIKAWIASGKTEADRDPRALAFIKLKKLLTETKSLRAVPDADGRIRCSYNLVGTETHRLSCSGSPTRTSKLNLQTVTKTHRVMYQADEGCYMGQRDLAGADGFTVAAYAAMLGDRTMLDDYAAKLKPAQIIVLMLDRGAAVNQLSRDELKPLCKPITEETDWRYFAMKRVQHGSSYMMGKNTTSDQILTDAYKKDGKPVYLAPKDCERIQQQCFFVRYPGIPRVHQWMANELKTKGVLVASNGFQRRFFGRKDDSGTVRQALAHLPQVYTTYATTLAIHRLWTDPENRRPDGSFIVEPLHTVHDSLVSQWKIEDTEFAKRKLHEWFRNPIQIANETLVIPASGTYGPSWGEQGESL